MWRLARFQRWSLVVLLIAVAAAGCTVQVQVRQPATLPSPSPSAPAPAPAQPGANCLDQAKQGMVARFDRDTGILFGNGRNGIVLVHSDNGDLCMWVPYALALTHLGYRVLAFDLPGHGFSAQLSGGGDAAASATVAAVEWLRQDGASQICLIGAAEGATIATVAAARITPPVSGLVSLSAMRQWGGLDAEQAVPGLLVPAMFIAGDLDATARDDATALFDAMPIRGVLHKQISVPGRADSGVNLLPDTVANGGSRGDTVHAQIESFLRDLTSAN
jgi:pimeloyl-ACP methyl ester carboxylesterase